MVTLPQASSEAAPLSTRPLTRNTFCSGLQSSVAPPERTGRHTLFAHREHQVWLQGSPLGPALCHPVCRAWASLPSYRGPGSQQCHTSVPAPKPGPRAVDGGTQSVSHANAQHPFFPSYPHARRPLHTSPHPSPLHCPAVSSPEEPQPPPLLKEKPPPILAYLNPLTPMPLSPPLAKTTPNCQ